MNHSLNTILAETRVALLASEKTLARMKELQRQYHTSNREARSWTAARKVECDKIATMMLDEIRIPGQTRSSSGT